jgi:hypothetical protein
MPRHKLRPGLRGRARVGVDAPQLLEGAHQMLLKLVFGPCG